MAESAETEVKEEEPVELKEAIEEKKEPEPPKEKEADAPADSRPKVKATVGFSTVESTINVLPWDGTFLKSLSSGGYQYLLAGARANVGVKSGRYLFECRIVESFTPNDTGGQARPPQPKYVVRAGFTPMGASLLQEGTDCVYFDSEGCGSFGDSKRQQVGTRFGLSVVGVLLNLDASSENANTISLFIDGVRASPPKALPDSLKGKTLYPTLTYKNVTLQVHFGPQPIVPLPFKCRTVQDAAQADTEESPVKPPKDGVYDVIVPIGLPDTGVYDWATDFMSKNAGYFEVSERHIVDWAQRSGIWVPKGTAMRSGSHDKPELTFGLPGLDDGSVRKTTAIVAPAVKRNYVLLGVKSNLNADDRKTVLSKFKQPHFRIIAKVLMGEPSADYKLVVQNMILAEKRSKAEAERQRKMALEEQKKKIESRKKAIEAAKRKKEGKPVEEEEAPEEKDVAMEPIEEPTLTDEEKQLWCRKGQLPDVVAALLGKVFSKFSLPSTDEGFAKIEYGWQNESVCQEKLKDWMTQKKRSTRVDDITPGDIFKEKSSEFQKLLKEWKALNRDWSDTNKRNALLEKKKQAALKKKQEAAKEAGEDVPTKADDLPEVNAEDLDVKAVEDVTDIGSGEPLFANFEYEDWVLLEMRYNLHLLMLSYEQDLNDPERPTFHESHAAFYYTKYFKKSLDLKSFKMDKLSQLVEVMSDTVTIQEDGMVKNVLPASAPISQFVKQCEEHRRERQRRVDAGDETAMLKFVRHAVQPSQPPGPQRNWRENQGPPRQPSSAPPGVAPGVLKRPQSSGPTFPPAKRPFLGGR